MGALNTRNTSVAAGHPVIVRCRLALISGEYLCHHHLGGDTSEYDVVSGARVGWCARGMLARDAQNDPLARQYGDERDKTKPHRTAIGAAIASSAVASRDQTGRVRAVRAGRQWAGFRWLPTAAPDWAAGRCLQSAWLVGEGTLGIPPGPCPGPCPGSPVQRASTATGLHPGASRHTSTDGQTRTDLDGRLGALEHAGIWG